MHKYNNLCTRGYGIFYIPLYLVITSPWVAVLDCTGAALRPDDVVVLLLEFVVVLLLEFIFVSVFVIVLVFVLAAPALPLPILLTLVC